MEVPPIVRKFYSYFPLHTYESEVVNSAPNIPTLWVSPPTVPSSRLSGDIECLKWQTYLALQKIPGVRFRYDIQPDGGVGGVLPSLHLRNGDFLSPSIIPSWANDTLQESIDGLEGYASLGLRDESRAWVTLFEGIIHSALLIAQPPSHTVSSYLDPTYDRSRTNETVASFFQPPLAPLTGVSSILPPFGLRIPVESVLERYHEAIQAVSDRLGTDQWFLASTSPTALDAIMFAYLHRALNTPNKHINSSISSRENLVLWERKVRTIVDDAVSQSH